MRLIRFPAFAEPPKSYINARNSKAHISQVYSTPEEIRRSRAQSYCLNIDNLLIDRFF